MELLCDRQLAKQLGAIEPATLMEHRALRDAGNLLVRDPMTGQACFWPWIASFVHPRALTSCSSWAA